MGTVLNLAKVTTFARLYPLIAHAMGVGAYNASGFVPLALFLKEANDH
jgi:hypothetical protein